MYIENHLANGEKIVVIAEKSKLKVVLDWIKVIIPAIIFILVLTFKFDFTYILDNSYVVNQIIMGITDEYAGIDITSCSILDLIRAVEILADSSNVDYDGQSLSNIIMTPFKIIFLLIVIIPLLKALWGTVLYIKTEIAVTNRRFVGKVGVLNTKTIDIALDKISSCGVEQEFWGKILNYSNITISAEGAVKHEIKYLKNAETLKTNFTELKRALEEEKAKAAAEIQAARMAKVLAEADEMNAIAAKKKAEMEYSKLSGDE